VYLIELKVCLRRAWRMSVMPESPSQAGRPVSAASAGGEDLLALRIAAALIDLAVLLGLSVIVSVTIGELSVEGRELAIGIVLAFPYYFALEAANGRTVGKLLLGLQVVGADWGRPSLWAVAIRTALRVVDWLPLLYLVGFAATIATGARRQRLGDLAAKTSVGRALPMQRRGLAAALLGSFLFLALAAWVVSAAVSSGLTSTSSSSTCVIDRCNATTRGDQVMDLLDHDVAVSEIGAGSATFTVDGDTVTLRVAETRQVGPSLIHLTSVEDDVAKYSVDFSGLFLNRSDLENESGDQVATYESYTQISDDQGVITVEVPAEWDDLDGREDPEYGPSIHAAPDLERFRQTWEVPGIMVEVSSRFGSDDISAIMNQGPSGQCTSEGREPYEDPLYAGEIERWTGCGGTDTAVVVAAVAPDHGGFLVRISGQAVDDRDLDAMDRALDTLQISHLGAAESDPITTDKDWLKKISALHNEIDDAIDDAIDKTDRELTSAALTEMAMAMRTCTREIASIGPPSARLQEIHARVKKACQEYDKGAECLSTAADINRPVLSAAKERRVSEALDCGFAGLNRGSERLTRAESQAEFLQTSPG
jgi:uncharacterized RDD family membrane protein YckC